MYTCLLRATHKLRASTNQNPVVAKRQIRFTWDWPSQKHYDLDVLAVATPDYTSRRIAYGSSSREGHGGTGQSETKQLISLVRGLRENLYFPSGVDAESGAILSPLSAPFALMLNRGLIHTPACRGRQI
jgi:hypothetical protein